MALAIRITLLTDSFDAADSTDRRSPEWPPHPARLFCAMVAAARTDEERDVLRWLERQDAPEVQAPGLVSTSTMNSYVVTNDTAKKVKGSQVHLGRINKPKSRTRVFPDGREICVRWLGADPHSKQAALLDRLCRRIPYLGRSTGVAIVSAEAAGEASAAERQPGLVTYLPSEMADGAIALRVPYPGYLDQLDVRYAADEPAWMANRYLYYRPEYAESPSPNAGGVVEEIPSAYEDLVIFKFDGVRPDGRLAPLFTERLRTQVLGRAGGDAPAALHGHNADGRPHVAFLALPQVAGGPDAPDAKYAKGHLLGLAVAVPGNLERAEREQVLRAVLGLRTRREHEGGADAGVVPLDVPSVGSFDLTYAPGLVRPWGLRPERWRRGSKEWVSATPVILDRYPKNPDQIEDIIRGSVRQVGLPEPTSVDISPSPLAVGAVAMRPNDLPKKFRGRLYRHVALIFEQPVAGPVLVGAGRYLGVGLFAPVRTSRDAETTASTGHGVEAQTATEVRR